MGELNLVTLIIIGVNVLVSFKGFKDDSFFQKYKLMKYLFFGLQFPVYLLPLQKRLQEKNERNRKIIFLPEFW